MRLNTLIASCSIAVPALLILSGCGRDDMTARDGTAAVETREAQVRFVNALHGNADLYFEEARVFGGEEKVSNYRPLPAERGEFRLRAPGRMDGEPLATNTEGLDAGGRYTVVAYPEENGGATLRVLKDDSDVPSQGKAKVRLVHAAPDMDDMSLYAAGRQEEIASKSMFRTGSNWQEVDPVQGPLEMRTDDRRTGAVQVPNVTLEAGKLYTFVVMKPGPGQRVQVTPIVDMPHDRQHAADPDRIG